LTAVAVAVKLALVALAGTVTVAGTVTDESLLDRFTVNPLTDAGAFNVTVQVSEAEPVTAPLEQESADNATTGFNCSEKVWETPLKVAVSVAD
jgi:hypothetical protein